LHQEKSSDDLPGSGEHYLDPARIDAKSSETRMSRRGDPWDLFDHARDLLL
jgi:hypothetical protein